MDQQVQLLWQYQEIDLQVAGVEKKLRMSPTRKKLVEARDYLLNSQNRMKKMEADAGELRINFDAVRKRYEYQYNELTSLTHYIAEGDRNTTLQEVEQMRKELVEIQNNLTRSERDLQKIIERLDAIQTTVNKIVATVPKAKRDYAAFKDVYDKEVAVIAQETAPFRTKMADLEKQIGPKLMTRYKNIKKTRVNPLAPLRDNRCSGCNMELPSVALKKAVESDAPLDCENCGRMLFLEQ